MKKILFGLLLSLLITSTGYALTEDGRTGHNGFVRFFMVEGRGLANVLSLPLEIPRTAVTEARLHHWLVPFTYIPRLFYNLQFRTISAAADIIFYPWVVPFTNDISPWTEPFGLPDYAWQEWGG